MDLIFGYFKQIKRSQHGNVVSDPIKRKYAMAQYFDKSFELILGLLLDELDDTIVLGDKLPHPHNLPGFFEPSCIQNYLLPILSS
jgi:hypothetical protein